MSLFVVRHSHEAARCPARDPQMAPMLLPDQDSVTRFMQPFAKAGTVEILPASPCEMVVQRGGCEG